MRVIHVRVGNASVTMAGMAQEEKHGRRTGDSHTIPTLERVDRVQGEKGLHTHTCNTRSHVVIPVMTATALFQVACRITWSHPVLATDVIAEGWFCQESSCLSCNGGTRSSVFQV